MGFAEQETSRKQIFMKQNQGKKIHFHIFCIRYFKDKAPVVSFHGITLQYNQ